MSTDSNRAYDKYKRNKEARAFYKSTAWKKCRLVILQRDHYLCQQCLRVGRITTANTVHHIKPLEDYPELALEEDNLESICPACHNQEHPEKGRGQKAKESKRNKVKIVTVEANEEVW